MKLRLIFIFTILFISGCGDDPNKIINKGGALSPEKTYTFNIFTINDIKATNNASEAKYCPPRNADCWRLWYQGDLSDYENGDYVNIVIEKGKIIEINSVWLPTILAYELGDIVLSHYNSTIFAKYIGAPLVVIFLLLILIGMFAPKEDETSGKNT